MIGVEGKDKHSGGAPLNPTRNTRRTQADPRVTRRPAPIDHAREAARRECVLQFLETHRAVLAVQGVVRETWRAHRGRRRGPYFRLVWRERAESSSAANTRRRGLYLGRSKKLAAEVRDVLAEWRRPAHEKRLFARLRGQALAAFRNHKRELRLLLASLGVQLKGWEFRGVRKAFPLPTKQRVRRRPF